MTVHAQQIPADFTYTDVFVWNYQSTYRYNINQGGTWSSKTRSEVQCMMMHAAEDPKSKGTIVGDNLTDMREGAIDDFHQTWESSKILQKAIKRYHKTREKAYFHNGSTLQFKSVNSQKKAKASGKRDYLFVNEANAIDYSIYEMLQDRTTKKIYLDYNPDAPFWVHSKVLPKEDAVRFISNCFEHNRFTPESIKRNILEKAANDANYERVYAYGVTGKIRGLVFKKVYGCAEFPPGARMVGYGLDWGYTNSPTVVVKLGLWQGKIYGKLIVYGYSMSTEQVATALKMNGVPLNATIVADSEDPKSIADLRAEGYRGTIPATKGKGSVKYGIKKFNEYPGIYLTHGSTQWHDEAARYKYPLLANGEYGDIPIDAWNHCWDAARYWAEKFLPTINLRGRNPQAGSA